MIWESRLWKQELIRTARRLKKKARRRRWVEATYVEFEKEIMVSAYIVRKLSESRKLSDNTMTKAVELLKFPKSGTEIRHWNRDQLDEHYDMDLASLVHCKFRDICNMLIHSYVFCPVFKGASAGAIALLFNSDWTKDSLLYQIELAKYISLLKVAGNDYPTRLSWDIDDQEKEHWRIG